MASLGGALKSASNAVKLAIGRAVLAAVSDSTTRQLIQFEALKGEVKDKVERVQQYGFTSVPLAGAHVLFVCVGSNRDHPVAISVDDPRFRKKDMQPGEVAIYTDEGDFIHFKRDKTVEISTANLVVNATDSVEINTTNLVVNASESARFATPILEATGHIIDHADSGGASMSNMRATYNSHTHPENNSGSTDEPNQPMAAV
jgi:phage baseplate assembly protein V